MIATSHQAEAHPAMLMSSSHQRQPRQPHHTIDLHEVMAQFTRARSQHQRLQILWQECLEFAQPHYGLAQKSSDRVFDSTVANAVEQLAAMLSAEFSSPSGRWFDIVPARSERIDGTFQDKELFHKGQRMIDLVSENLQRSNFAVEIHQCFIDLVTIGTATLSFQETPMGETSAFLFKALPHNDIILNEGISGRLDHIFHSTQTTVGAVRHQWGKINDQLASLTGAHSDPITIAEAILPRVSDMGVTRILIDTTSTPRILRCDQLPSTPLISFRWSKIPSGIYGRSPVMNVLPDVKTANRMVELVLQNASVATSGIWQADEDGILDIDSIDLVPGAIIPKAVGSQGLSPLATNSQFDLSQLVLEELRAQIRKGMMTDYLGKIQSTSMTATEVIARSSEMNRIFGATVARLQSELLLPLAKRAVSILHRRGMLDATPLFEGQLEIIAQNPIYRLEANDTAQSLITWLQMLPTIYNAPDNLINKSATAQWLARTLGVPHDLISIESMPAPTLTPTLTPAPPTNNNPKPNA